MTVMYVKCGMIMRLLKQSQTTGLSISHAAVWNVIQAFGDKLVHDGKVVTARHSLVCMMELPTIA